MLYARVENILQDGVGLRSSTIKYSNLKNLESSSKEEGLSENRLRSPLARRMLLGVVLLFAIKRTDTCW